jgi:hypothetical protein
MADLTISGAGAHSTAEATDRLPAMKSTTPGYHTPLTIKTYILSLANTFVGAITPTGGVAAAGGFSVLPSNVHTFTPMVAASGTDITPSVSINYYAAVLVPCNMTITGVRILLGSATNGNAKVGLFNSAGALLKTSVSTDISAVGNDTYTQIAFTGGTYAAVGPATYYVGLLQDSTSNRFRCIPFGAMACGNTTGETYATGFTTIASPSTIFTASVGPIATLY